MPYSFNGNDVTVSELGFLKIVDERSLRGVEFQQWRDPEFETVMSLMKRGLVKAAPYPSRPMVVRVIGLTYEGKATLQGFLDDEAKAEREKRSQRRHDWRMRIVGGIFGFALGILTSYLVFRLGWS